MQETKDIVLDIVHNLETGKYHVRLTLPDNQGEYISPNCDTKEEAKVWETEALNLVKTVFNVTRIIRVN